VPEEPGNPGLSSSLESAAPVSSIDDYWVGDFWQRDAWRYQRVLQFVLVWVFAIAAAMYFIDASPDPVWKRSDYAVRYGYTVSLALIYLPWAFLLRWYFRTSRTDPYLRVIGRAVFWNAAFIGGIWIILDITLANLLFEFPDERAHLSGALTAPWAKYLSLPGYLWSGDCNTVWNMWRLGTCYGFTIPLEEVFFYLGSAALLRMLYMWASEDFFSRYTVPRRLHAKLAHDAVPIAQLDKKFLVAALAVLVAGIVIKKMPGTWLDVIGMRWHGSQEGWPYYLMFELALVFGTLAALYKRVHKFTNARAFLFVMALQVLISIVWEATLALPYGWWNYRMTAMIGVTIMPWSRLALEGSFLWVSVGWSVMLMYEAAKIQAVTGYSWRKVLRG
jgi:hypothetical protein